MEVALESWKAIQLSVLQEQWNSKGLAITDAQQQGKASRQKLAEDTKAFKRVSDEEKLNQFKTLLRNYQMEIDSVTQRARNAETAFLEMYQKLGLAPDPVPLIENIISQSTKLREMGQLKTENERLQSELAKLNPQAIQELESLNTSLKQRLIGYEIKMEEMVKEQVDKKEQEMRVLLDEKTSLFRESEHALERQISHLKNEIVNLRTSHQNAQEKLLSKNQDAGDSMSGKSAEMDLLVQDLERARYKIAQLENETKLLQEELQAKDSTNDQELQVQELQQTMQGLENQLKEEQEVLLLKEAEVAKLRSDYDKQVKELLFNLNGLQNQLATMSDYEDLKKELKIIKDIEFVGVSPTMKSFTIEQLLAQKNKKLETELTTLKNKYEKTEAHSRTLESELGTYKKKVEEQSILVAKLENDLARMNQAPPAPVRPNHSGLEELITGGLVGNANTSSPPGDLSSRSAQSDMIPILKSQRDRFRQRNEELEDQIRSHLQKIQYLESQLSGLKADNVKLYEKIRYMESFSSSSNGRKYVGIPIQKDASDLDITGKYQHLYENTLDPFKRFHKQEESRQIKSMNPAERLAFTITQVVVSNRQARWIFIAYLVGLHFLVISSMYQVMLTTDSHHEMATNMAHNKDTLE